MGDGALSDLSVLELAQGVAGPFCGKLFADLGADVIKVEPPEGDRSRRHGPFPGDEEHSERSGQFIYLNHNKRSVTLDIHDEASRELLRRLVGHVDVLVIDLPPKQLEELALTYEELRPLNERLIMTAITPFGLVGPWRDHAATDFTAYMMSGLGYQTPYGQVTDLEAQPPLAGGGYQTDYLAGATAAAATMIAVFHRRASGEGQLVDISRMESVNAMVRNDYSAASYTPERVPPRIKHGYAWVLPCEDGYLSFSPFNADHWWASFKELAGQPGWAQSELFDTAAGRQEHSDLLEQLTIEWLLTQKKFEIYEAARDAGIPCFPVNSMQELIESRQYRHREFFVEVEHPEAGTLTQPGPPARYSLTPVTVREPAPRLGAHNAEVLEGLP
ncbi:MAG: CoA transferase [Chloroflexi bacterium]|nr:CoA transferase [Chloroflexota bacterium]